MKEIYRLDGANLPTLPTPHDAIIKHIKREDDFLIFTFEDDISWHDSVKYQSPSAKSLIIKYHLIDDYTIYYYKWNKLRKRSEYLELKNEKILFEADRGYCFQYVMYRQMIIQTSQKWRKSYILHLFTDYVEYEWIE